MSVQIKGVGTIGGIDQGLNTVGVITATSFVGSGANLTSLPAQATIANNADNRVITGGSGVNLNGEANLTFDGSTFAITGGVTATALSTFSASGSALRLNDGSILRLGNADADFFLYHDGSSTDYISAGAGKQLRLTTDDFVIKGANNTETLMTAAKDGAVALYHNNTLKLETTSDGSKVTGELDVFKSGTGDVFHVRGNGTAAVVAKVENAYNSDNDRFAILELKSGKGSIRFNSNGDSNEGAITYNMADNTMVFGVNNASEKLRIQSGGGISFNGDTATANALDDYEEGSWTPSIKGTSGAGTASYSTRTGRYTKVGNFVHITFEVNWSSGSAGGELRVTDLPFSPTTDYEGIGSCMFHTVYLHGNEGLCVYVGPGVNYTYFYQSRSNDSWHSVNYDSAGIVIGNVSYRTA